ncbi:MAG: glycosyltransferase [Deltaproteobacteria bacterium]|nr:glycosyltransferase [Deltaproteobacteria bacterium]
MKLSVIIPAYNEVHTLPRVVERVRAVTGFPLEILLVDDGSTDGTAEVARALVGRGVDRVFFHPHNRGKGAAIRTALPHVTGDYVVFQDADLEYDPQDFHRLLAPVLTGAADVVYGSRFQTGQARRVMYFWHSVGNHALTTVSNAITNLNLSDVETCYKLIPAAALRQLTLEEERFGIEVELTAKLARMDLRFYEVGISYAGRTYAEGKKVGLVDGLDALRCLARYGRGRYRDYGKQTLQVMETLGVYAQQMHRRLSPWYGRRILEIGSGIGNNVAFLQQGSPDSVILTDYRADYVDLLRQKFHASPGVECLQYDATLPVPEALLRHPPDTIVCLNVLEHIQDDRLALQHMFETLAPGGRLVLLVPAFQALYCEIDRNLEHHRRYGEQQLRALMAGVGFTIQESFHFNPVGFVGWWVAGKVLGARQINNRHVRTQERLMPVMRALERLDLPFGLSVVCIGEKPA